MNWHKITLCSLYVQELAKLFVAGKINAATFLKNVLARNQLVQGKFGSNPIMVMEACAVAEEMEWRRAKYEIELERR